MKGEVTILISGRVDFRLRTVSEIKESIILINISMYLLPELQNKWYNNCHKWKNNKRTNGINCLDIFTLSSEKLVV